MIGLRCRAKPKREQRGAMLNMPLREAQWRTQHRIKARRISLHIVIDLREVRRLIRQLERNILKQMQRMQRRLLLSIGGQTLGLHTLQFLAKRAHLRPFAQQTGALEIAQNPILTNSVAFAMRRIHCLQPRKQMLELLDRPRTQRQRISMIDLFDLQRSIVAAIKLEPMFGQRNNLGIGIARLDIVLHNGIVLNQLRRQQTNLRWTLR
mmetsp:Transcript_14018/g.21130  ORF Transcript_14018/g.21130 Transcript_14018/m.21130 type:complete len:208 (+) Transcript_14018:678-1301(+)